MTRNFSRLLPVAAMVLLTTAGASAQRPGGPGGPGGFQPPPGMQAKFQAWRTWRDTHKNVGSLERTLGGLVAVEQDPKTKLTKPQARAVLGVLRKWQGKPSLTDAQAFVVNTQLTHTLTPAQLGKLAAAQERGGRRGPGGPPPGGPGGFGGGRGFGGPPPGGPGGPPFGGRGPGGPGGGRGPGGPGGGRPPFDPASFPAPRDYNPLNPNTQPMARRRDRDKLRHAQLMAALFASAK